MNGDLLRLVDGISRDKSIDKDQVFADLESAMVSAVRKAYDDPEEVAVSIDRMSGEIQAIIDGKPISVRDLGRIAAQTAKQVMIQKIREAERSSIFDEFQNREGQIITGNVARFEGGALVVNVGRAEGFLPRSEQIPGESHHPGERIRAMILEVREAPNQVKIILTRTHPDFIRRLFELEVPEVAERIIELKAMAREAGYRTKIAVSSIDTKVDAVGACVGVRGSRIKNIVEELGGEKIDIVRWNESSQIMIGNALKPAEVQEIALCFELGRVTVVVVEDQLSLAIGKRGQNVRLAARLTGWDIDILTPAEYNKSLDDMCTVLKSIESVNDVLLDKMLAMGLISLVDIEEVGAEPLVNAMEIDEALANEIVALSAKEAKRLQEEAEVAKEKEAAEKAAKAEAEASGLSDETTDAANEEARDEADSATNESIETSELAGASASEGDEASPEGNSEADGKNTEDTDVGGPESEAETPDNEVDSVNETEVEPEAVTLPSHEETKESAS
jgi:N utilization substance protein A